MNEKEIMQWAVKGIEAEISKKEKSLRKGLLLIQAHNKGIQKSKLGIEELNKRVEKVRDEIELLARKKAFLTVQLEDWR